MSHAAVLTDQAIGLLDGRDRAKRLSGLVLCSFRTVEGWIARRRAMCLDHAIEMAARNDEFRAALMARIEEVRGTNEGVRTETVAGGRNGAAVGVGSSDRRRGVGGETGCQGRAAGAGSARRIAVGGSAGEGA